MRAFGVPESLEDTVRSWFALAYPDPPASDGRYPLGASAVSYSTRVRAERFVFDDLRTVLARANEEKSGDRLAGLAADSERERVAAKRVLADLTLGEIVANPLIDPDED